ncbi:MAG TPA: hypothetical protein VIG07_13805 [Methylomirabilota bacterium]
MKKPNRSRAEPAPAAVAEPTSALPAVRTATPERVFAGRVKPPVPAPPLPAGRRAIFVDVENSSRADHISRVLDHLAIDRRDRRVELIAVGNWRVIGADSARLLARRGAHLVHSAPSTGVRDWSDLRIAVSAGVWLGSARPGDLIEIISDDRAFDAVGDVAAVLGVEYRRLSYRGLTGLAAPEEPAPQEAPAPREGRGRRGGRGRRRGRGRGRPEHAGRGSMPARGGGGPQHVPARPLEPARAHVDASAHTAPHDELVDVVRELADHAPNNAVLIDTLARALKERGFSRPPGSPRLITRLRRIRELVVSRTGMITLADAAAGGEVAPPAEAEGADAEVDTLAEPSPGGETAPAAGAPRRSRRRRRRRRRGGGGGAPAPASVPA